MSWCSGLEEICRADVPLAEHTWYGLGGPARWFVSPRSEDELRTVLRRCADSGIPWRILGRGANVLVRDEGFDGAVIHPAFDEMRLDRCDAVFAAAGADFTHLVRAAVKRGYAGLENLAGIPGSVGGIVRMNAGGRYGSIGQYVDRVRVMRPDGELTERPASEMDFAYRHARLDGGIVTGVTLRLVEGDPGALLTRFRHIWNEKAAAQPAVSARSAGCIFKNPPGDAAGRLIDACGLKGTRIGGAEISSRHANFIVAYPGAAARDVIDLIDRARERVRDATGVELELEIEVW